jgi:hypothetical protein
MRFTFIVAGWPGSVHDMRVFKDAIDKYGDKFPHPPQGIAFFYDSFRHIVAFISIEVTFSNLDVQESFILWTRGTQTAQVTLHRTGVQSTTS